MLLGNTNIPRLKPPFDRIYLLGFNGGDGDPLYWHWIVGMGTLQAIRHWVLSDADNEVKGKPTEVKMVMSGDREVEIWRFPPHPAGDATLPAVVFPIPVGFGYKTVEAAVDVR